MRAGQRFFDPLQWVAAGCLLVGLATGSCGGRADATRDAADPSNGGMQHASGASSSGTGGTDPNGSTEPMGGSDQSSAIGGRFSVGNGGGGLGGGGLGGGGLGVAGLTASATGGAQAPTRGTGGSTATAHCGNGFVESDLGEECDDQNNLSGDGCSSKCQIEDWDPCGPDLCRRTIICGDGAIGPGEVCDDGNATGADGCSTNCDVVEPGYYCPVPGQRCLPLPQPPSCGNGILEPELGEFCDAGSNGTAYSGCTQNCLLGPYCGDDVVQPNFGEQCDFGSANAPDGSVPYGGCSTSCRLGPYCGDGILQLPEEECDEGTGGTNYVCLSTCRFRIID